MAVEDARVKRAKKAIEEWLNSKSYGGISDWSGKFSYNQYRESGGSLIFDASNPVGSFSYNLTSGEVKKL
ncbi:hypothetical protein M1271_04520 [Patescibacteria group bacterium]|nr:hypothetical protein [Patescibacteria group bacterium]MCL5798378.1 hypothetical protein [Patescibacteria group bacterium]